MGGIYQVITGGGFPPAWTAPSFPNTPGGQISQQSVLPFVSDPDTPIANLVFAATAGWPSFASISGSNLVIDATLLNVGNVYSIPPIDAYDGATHSASPSFTITIIKGTNRPPIWNNPTSSIPASVTQGTPFTYDLNTICSDLDGDLLSFEPRAPLTLPPGWSINGSLLTITTQASNGQTAMTFRAWDGGALLLGANSDSLPITFNVQVQSGQQPFVFTVYPGENVFLKTLPIPTGAVRTGISFDTGSSGGAQLGQGVLTGCTMLSSFNMATSRTSFVPGTASGLFFRQTYTGHADELIPVTITMLSQPLPLGFKLYRGSDLTTVITQKERLVDLYGFTQPGDVITVTPLMPDGVTPRAYQGTRYGSGNLSMANQSIRGKLTVKSEIPGKRWIIDYTVDPLLADKTGAGASFFIAYAFTGVSDLELQDGELRSLFNGNNSPGDNPMVTTVGASTPGTNGQPLFANNLVLRNVFLNGDTCGISTSAPFNGALSGTWNITIPSVAPFEVSLWAPLESAGGQPFALWAKGQLNYNQINNVNAPYVAGPAPGVLGSPAPGQFSAVYTTTPDNRGVTYRFNSADAGKSAVLSRFILPSNYANDTSTSSYYNSEFTGLGGIEGPSHSIYVNHNFKLYVEGCWAHDEFRPDGFLCKTKCRENTLIASRFENSNVPERSGRVVDLSLAATVKLYGCLFIKRPSIGNAYPWIMGVGFEFDDWDLRDGRVTSFECYQCTFINYDPKAFDHIKLATGTFCVDGTPFPLDMANVNTGTNLVIKDCIFAGYNAPTIAGNTTGPTDPAQFATFFEDELNFRPRTQIAGSRNWATLEYVHPAQSRARTDSSMGAVSPVSSMPFWATNDRLQPGTWYEIDVAAGGNQPRDLDSKALTPTPGQYDHWKGFSDVGASTFWQWTGGVYASAYCPFGAVLYYGGGHTTTSSNQINTKVIAWRADTARFELAALPWFEIGEVLPGNASQAGNAVDVGFGNPNATLRWGLAPYTSFAFTPTIQSDPDLGKWGEYSFGVPACSQTYASLAYLQPCPGMTKGALFSPVCMASTGSGVPAGGYPHWCDLSKSPNAKAQTVWSRFYDRQWKPWPPPYAVFAASTANTRTSIAYSIALDASDGVIISDARAGFGSQTQGKCNISGHSMYGGDGSQFEFCAHPFDTSGAQDIIMAFTGDSPKGPVIVLTKDITVGGTVAVRRVVETYQGNPGRPQDPTTTGNGLPERWCGFTYCVDLDCIFMISIGSATAGYWPGDPRGVVLWKMKFPTDRINGTYVWTSEVLTRSTYQNGRPDDPHDWGFNGNGPPSAGMYNKLRYIPAAKALAYCHLIDGFMRVFRPSGLTPITYALSWTAQPGAISYRIYMGYSSGVYFTSVDVGNVLTYTLTNLLADTKYYLRLKSWNGSTETSLDEIAVLNGLQVAP